MTEVRHDVGLIGAGIGASLSPELHEREGAEQGLRYRYRLIELDDGAALDGAVADARRAGFSGLNITHPFKQDVLACLDELAPGATALQAVNTVVFAGDRAIGHNTDTTGFAQSFERGLPDAALDHVVLLGAGGAGAAVGHAVLRLGAERLTVVDVDPERAEACARQLDPQRAAPGSLDELAEADGLIHATPTGMHGHGGMPLDADLLTPAHWVAEVVYRPLETELIRRARALGCRTLDGGGMAVFQAAASFELFTGIAADRERMLRHFAQLVDEATPAGAGR